MSRRRLAFGALVALATAVGAQALAGDWARFRGPNGTGVSTTAALPVTFGPEENLEWTTAVPFGRSSPVLGGELLYLTAVEGEELETVAVDRKSGAIRWRRTIPRSRHAEIHVESDSSTPSPTTDGANVYVFFQEAGVVSYDDTGHERWRHPLGPFANYYGMASSPVLAEGALLLLCDQSSGSYLVALDKDTGRERWRAERPGRSLSYTTPLLFPDAVAPRLVIVAGSKWIDAYDVASGEPAWSMGGVGAGPVASPTLAGGRLYVTAIDQADAVPPPFPELLAERDTNGDGVLTKAELSGTWMEKHLGWLDTDRDGVMSSRDWDAIRESVQTEGWGLFGIRLPGEGNAKPEIVWNYRRNVAYIPSPIVVDGVLFTVDDSILTSLDALTGAVHKRGRLGRAPAKVFASPVAADGKIYFATLDGGVVVVEAAPDWEVLATNELGAPIYATPLIADGHIYVRTRERLLSFALPARRDETRD